MLARFAELLALESVWADDQSVETYYFALASFISMNHEFFVFHCGDYTQRYFPPDLDLRFGDACTYADCGAYDGSEALMFADRAQRRFRQLHVFEPDRRNFLNVTTRVNAYIAEHGYLPIHCHELGVFDRNAFLAATGYEAGVSVIGEEATGNGGIHVCRLDDMLDDLGYLRLEIEGAELAALHGAEGLIRAHRPGMTISAYHKASDFLDIADFLRPLELGYKLRLRHQSLEPGVLCVYCS
jgi:FkbM family methyltransferase